MPVRADALPIGLGIGMIPGPDGSLYVSIPSRQGLVLARLDAQGRPLDGWPISVPDSTACGDVHLGEAGSTRVVCGYDLVEPGLIAFGFDSDGRSLEGWPVPIAEYDAARVIGDVMVLVHQETTAAWLTSIAGDGTMRTGAQFPLPEGCCSEWAIGLDGAAYTEASSAGTNRIVRLDVDGARLIGPLIDGQVSRPAFYADGRIALLVGKGGLPTSRVLVVHPGDGTGASIEIEMPTLDAAEAVDCVVDTVRSPIVVANGMLVVHSDMREAAVFALDRDLRVRAGWPVDPGPREHPNPYRNEEGLSCAGPAILAAGPDGTLLLPWMAADESIGGRLAAVAPDGGTRPGWPMALRKPGAEFWSVVAGPDATVYALAIEPESGRRASATILAIAPDGAVRYRSTIVDP